MEKMSRNNEEHVPFLQRERLEVEGDRDMHNMLIFRHPDVRGEIFITFPESEDDGIPEVDYYSGTSVGTGTARDIFKAVALAKMALEIYRRDTGYTGTIAYRPDNRDGFGEERLKIFKRYLPELGSKGLYQ